MGETTEITWCDATVNFWWGCTKVSPGCARCYADSLAHRWGKDVWGPGKPREDHRAGANKLADKLERQAVREGRRLRVFSASMSDWLDREADPAWLADLLAAVARTPHLDWLLLSKRPHLWRERVTEAWKALLDRGAGTAEKAHALNMFDRWLDGEAPANAWVGTTVEDQQRAEERIPSLLEIPARVRFLSCEPLLGPVDLGEWIERIDLCDWCQAEHPPQKEDRCPSCKREGLMVSTWGHHQAAVHRGDENGDDLDDFEPLVHWIIAGGESGHGARPMHPAWARSLRDQATSAGVAFHFKQWGEHVEVAGQPGEDDGTVEAGDGTFAHMRRVGKKAAGRLLDGRTWDELPAVTRG